MEARILSPSTPRTPRLVTLAVAFLLTGLGALGCSEVHADVSAATEGGQAGAPAAVKSVAVTTTPARQRTFEERLTVQGNLNARTSAQVGPKLPGTLAEVAVREGDRVVAGETVLFRTDDAQRKKAVEADRLSLALAKAGIQEARARLAQVDIELRKAKRDYERFQTLHRTATVTEDALEQMETRYLATKASRDHVKVLVHIAHEKKKQAAVALAISEQNLADATILAPVNGVITERKQEKGEMGAPGKAVVHIDDPSTVEVSAFLPAAYYTRVVVGETKMRVRVYGEDLGLHAVSLKSPTIDAKTRTFEVQALIANPDGRVAPGAMAQIDLSLSRKEGLGVPAAAIVKRSGESVVFLAEGDLARMVAIERGIESDGWVEVKNGALDAGAPVVTLGQSMLDEGTPLRVTQP